MPQPPPGTDDVTALLQAWRQGDADALNRLVPLVYTDLRRLARAHLRHESPDQLLQTTALVHEAYLRLLDASHVDWHDRVHFFSVSSRVMRRVLVDASRARRAQKRAGGAQRVPLEEAHAVVASRAPDLLSLDAALTRLEREHPRRARIVELRYFGGLTLKEIATMLEVSVDTVTRDWTRARLALLMELKGGLDA